jgi:hypothetical protein
MLKETRHGKTKKLKRKLYLFIYLFIISFNLLILFSF